MFNSTSGVKISKNYSERLTIDASKLFMSSDYQDCEYPVKISVMYSKNMNSYIDSTTTSTREIYSVDIFIPSDYEMYESECRNEFYVEGIFSKNYIDGTRFYSVHFYITLDRLEQTIEIWGGGNNPDEGYSPFITQITATFVR